VAPEDRPSYHAEEEVKSKPRQMSATVVVMAISIGTLIHRAAV
jgi:hypothetical protein